MSFSVGADAYDSFMGRYSTPLAPQLADFAGIEAGQVVLDVGCGPGALTGELVMRLGSESVSAVDPSESFVAAAQERYPQVSVRLAAAEQLPFADQTFDATLAQLVVHFMTDPVLGLREMGRVTSQHGLVAACVWDHAGGQGPLSAFWEASRQLDPHAPDESLLAGAGEGQLGQLFQASGLHRIEESVLTVGVEHPSFQAWWEPFTLGVGPAGAYISGLDEKRRAELRERCREMLPSAPFSTTAVAWAARGHVQ